MQKKKNTYLRILLTLKIEGAGGEHFNLSGRAC
jgi:hypothetical protein